MAYEQQWLIDALAWLHLAAVKAGHPITQAFIVVEGLKYPEVVEFTSPVGTKFTIYPAVPPSQGFFHGAVEPVVTRITEAGGNRAGYPDPAEGTGGRPDVGVLDAEGADRAGPPEVDDG